MHGSGHYSHCTSKLKLKKKEQSYQTNKQTSETNPGLLRCSLLRPRGKRRVSLDILALEATLRLPGRLKRDSHQRPKLGWAPAKSQGSDGSSWKS